MTPAIVKGLMEKRPFPTILEFNQFLLDQKLTADQARELYGKAFVKINLNTGKREEFLLIPRVGTRMSAAICTQATRSSAVFGSAAPSGVTW